MIPIILEHTEQLQKGKCLLGFSGGGDSVALFFLLLEQGVRFDLAIINHGLRPQAQAEVAYALDLGHKHAKQVHVWHAPLKGTNIEARARLDRYGFFERLVAEFGYEFVLLAHHLNDKLEWFLMQLAKGASLQTLLGFEALEDRERYTIARPLIYTPKRALREYLHANHHRYFEDHTNDNPGFRRNAFRHYLSDVFLDARIDGFDMVSGLRRSFQALRLEKQQLYPPIVKILAGGVWVFRQNNQSLYYIDGLLKRLGYVMSGAQRTELQNNHLHALFVTRAKIYCVGASGGFVFVGSMPHATQQPLPKTYREKCRVLKIPKTLRHALYGPEWQTNLEAIRRAKLALCAPSN